jgi:hypothetical protein
LRQRKLFCDAAVDGGVSDVYVNLTFTLDAAPAQSTRMFISQKPRATNVAQRIVASSP